jgi:asparagine synthase (glutamine-hydrolysing)
MSNLIGYWTTRPESDASEKLLLSAVSREAKVSSTPNSCIAVEGKQVSIKIDDDRLCGAISAAGQGFSSDVWVKVSNASVSLSRDIFGRVPLFWTIIHDSLWFSNRLQSLLKVMPEPRLSIDGFYAYGSLSYIPAPQTPVMSVFAIEAGTESTWTTVHAKPTATTLHQWREAENQSDDEPGEAQRLRRLLEERTNEQLANYAGEPIGVFLSGGLDSSITAAMLVRAGVKVRAYTLEFQAECFSEVSYAEHVAESLGIPLKKIPVAAESLSNALPDTTKRLDGLFGDGVTVPLALLNQRASEEVATVFNGEGGDQLFAGWTNKPLIAASIYEGAESFIDHYMRTFHRFYGHEAGVYGPLALRKIDAEAATTPVAKALDPSFSQSLFHRLRRANLLLKGADNIQPRATNLGLSRGLNVRTIFCSLPLADWTFGVSSKLWLHAGCEKYLLKRAVEDMLPANIVWREKRGMGVPLTQWLTGPLSRWRQKQLDPRVLDAEGLWQADLDQRIVAGELSGHVQGRRIGESLWLLLMWRAWRDRSLR